MTAAMVLRPQNFDQLTVFATMAAKSALVPRDYQGKPENIMLAVQMGSELGLAPMQALQNIAVVNGRPAVWGDAMLALCKASAHWDKISERIEGEGDAMRAVCEVHRKGDNPVIVTFAVEDAKRAGLWGKGGPWTQYPKRMLQMRARGFALRDAFPDALRGLISAEEAADIPTETFRGTTIEATPEPGPATREEINAAVPLPEKTPEERARDWVDNILARIAESDEIALHNLAGDGALSAHRTRLAAKYPGLDAEITSAMTARFNALIVPEGGVE